MAQRLTCYYFDVLSSSSTQRAVGKQKDCLKGTRSIRSSALFKRLRQCKIPGNNSSTLSKRRRARMRLGQVFKGILKGARYFATLLDKKSKD